MAKIKDNNGNITFVDTATLGITNKERVNQKVKKYGLQIQDDLTVENHDTFTFDRENILSIQQCSLINNKNIYLQEKSRIVGITNIGGLGDLLFFLRKNLPL